MSCAIQTVIDRSRFVPSSRSVRPRRVYTERHIDYVIEVLLEIWKRRDDVHGMKLTYEAPFLRHFTANLEPVS